jgi:hypothetical protein
MNENRISISLTDEEITTINKAIQILAEKFQPILIALEAGDKKNLTKIGEKSISFVDKASQYAKTNPEFLPPFINADEMKKNFDAFTVLNNFLRPLNQITKNLDDTATLCGSDAIMAALGYYKLVGQAKNMGVPNAAAIYEDLSQRFEAQKNRRNKSATPKISG